ncbi:YezD family protein [Phycisphaerales bacterium AB-hyl4]|uniref:YezD family protein n=1 Tax=Natronomicrosphaera hydrolytica TaxID=3242702 RepID=A0ABV4U6Z4_9BACT
MPTDASQHHRAPPLRESAWLAEVQRKAAGLRFGQLTLTIHDGHVVQLEVSEKQRFDNPLDTRVSG